MNWARQGNPSSQGIPVEELPLPVSYNLADQHFG